MATCNLIIYRIYVLRDPRDGWVRYVGFTHLTLSRRLAHHIAEAKKYSRKTHKNSWIRLLLTEGQQPFVELIECVVLRFRDERERYWIAWYLSQGCPLVNATLGGEGGWGWNRGQHLSNEHKAKISVGNKGKYVSDATRFKQKVAKLGKKHGPMSQEQKNKLREIALTKKQNNPKQYTEDYQRRGERQKETWDHRKERGDAL